MFVSMCVYVIFLLISLFKHSNMTGSPSRPSSSSPSPSPSSSFSRPSLPCRFFFFFFSFTALTGFSALLVFSSFTSSTDARSHFSLLGTFSFLSPSNGNSPFSTSPFHIHPFPVVNAAETPSTSSTLNTKTDTTTATDSSSSSSSSSISPPPIEELGYYITNTLTHDKEPFTQGLSFWRDGQNNGKHLFEGTGLYGESVLRHIDAQTGKERSSVKLNSNFFGEGITIIPLPLTAINNNNNNNNNNLQEEGEGATIGDKLAIIQITWKEQTAFFWEVTYPSPSTSKNSKVDFKMIKTVRFETHRNEGWGITYYPETNELIASDGSHYLFFWDPVTLEERKRIKVKGLGLKRKDTVSTLKLLNELEYINGKIWANVWFSDKIYEIDPHSGFVTRSVDFSKLFPQSRRESQDQVLNGIAYDEVEDLFYITGKWWPSLFEIKLCSNGQVVQVTQEGEAKSNEKTPTKPTMMTCPAPL